MSSLPGFVDEQARFKLSDGACNTRGLFAPVLLWLDSVSALSIHLLGPAAAQTPTCKTSSGLF